jgi:hypothetical protein
MKALFIFVDGLGMRGPSADNPVNKAVCPNLCELVETRGRLIDACLGMPGLPQSATGQASLYTGVNAARQVGRHMEGFPGPTLRSLLNADNLFLKLHRQGLRVKFADAYMADHVEEIEARRFKSVTTVMGLTCPQVFSFREDMLANQAVFHDITRESLLAKGYSGPVITPAKAAEHLIQLAITHDFTLFEFFHSDLAGHSMNIEEAVACLQTLDAFIGPLAAMARQANLQFILTSDHGNIEDMSVNSHTTNPVPFVVLGPGADAFLDTVHGLTDVTPGILRTMVA